jgi:hypothetical protein
MNYPLLLEEVTMACVKRSFVRGTFGEGWNVLETSIAEAMSYLLQFKYVTTERVKQSLFERTQVSKIVAVVRTRRELNVDDLLRLEQVITTRIKQGFALRSNDFALTFGPQSCLEVEA